LWVSSFRFCGGRRMAIDLLVGFQFRTLCRRASSSVLLADGRALCSRAFLLWPFWRHFGCCPPLASEFDGCCCGFWLRWGLLVGRGSATVLGARCRWRLLSGSDVSGRFIFICSAAPSAASGAFYFCAALPQALLPGHFIFDTALPRALRTNY